MVVASKIKKLLRMSPAEVLYRARELVRVQEERRRYGDERDAASRDDFDFWEPPYASVWRDLQAGRVQKALAEAGWMRKLFIPLDETKAHAFREESPADVEHSLARAELFLQNRFRFFGRDFHFAERISWQQDPVTGRPYPQGFYRDIEIFKNDQRTDVKFVWELNRLQFLIEIGKAYYLSGDPRYREKIDALVRDWHDHNPYKTGIAWTSALEVGVRSLSFLWTLNFYLAAGGPNPETVRLLLKLLYLGGAYISENLSIYFSPYNHLIGEAAALFLIGYLFPGFKNAGEWQQRGWQLLCDQIDRQFHADGGCVEQATFYHHFTLGFYLQAMAARKLNGDDIPAAVHDRVEKALAFALGMTRPDGTLPWIGDIDAARSLYVSDPAHWDFTGFQCIGAVWYRRSDMKWRAGRWSEEAHWLLPLDDREIFEALPAQPPTASVQFFPESGYFVARSGFTPDSHFGFMDVGPLAAGVFRDRTPSAAHGHADALSVEMAPFGEPLLIDPGFSNYRGEEAWHEYFRSTRAHNTLEIDGVSQARQVGILHWAHAFECRTLQIWRGETASGICAEHDGYRRLPGCIQHRRYFLFVEQRFWVVLDWLYAIAPGSKQEHSIRHGFHFAEQAEVELDEPRRNIIASGKRGRLHIHLMPFSGGTQSFVLARGGDGPEQGWISPTYRDRRPAPVVVWQMQSPMPFALVSVYWPDALRDGSARLQRLQNSLHIASEKARYRISVKPSAQSTGRGVTAEIVLPHRQRNIVLMTQPVVTDTGAPLFMQELQAVEGGDP